MPQVTVYIREDDIDAWRGVVKKSEFIHNALLGLSTYDGAKIELREDLPPTPATKVPRSKGDILAEINEVKREADQALEYCQDAEEAKAIRDSAKEKTDELWEEYHAN